MLRLAILLLLGITRFLGCKADCNTCVAETGIACVSNSTFQFCDTTNTPFGNTLSCPTGYYCTANTTICSTTSAFRACDECGVCSSDLRFACITSRTFALCLGTNDYLTYNITGTCADGYVCNLENQYICGTAAEGSPASCPLSSGNETINPSDYTPTEYCQLVQQAGRFPYGVTPSTTCKQYVSCYIYNSVWYGALYTCPGSTYFDSAQRICVTEIPARCTASVTSLRLNNLLLI